METPIVSKKHFNHIFSRTINHDGNGFVFRRVHITKKKMIFIHTIKWGKLVNRNYVLNTKKFKHLCNLGFSHTHIKERYMVYELKINRQYIDSVKNLFDLALSDIEENRELAYQIFQNIKEYSKSQ